MNGFDPTVFHRHDQASAELVSPDCCVVIGVDSDAQTALGEIWYPPYERGERVHIDDLLTEHSLLREPPAPPQGLEDVASAIRRWASGLLELRVST